MIRLLVAASGALMVFSTAGWGAVPLVPPQIKDLVLTGQLSASQSTVCRSLTLAGDYLYVSGQPGLQTIRASNPMDLVFTHDYADTSLQPNQSAVKSGVLYLANWSPGVGLLMLNLANPAQPTHLRTLTTPRHAWCSEIFENTLYLTFGDETDSGVTTYNITDPANPAPVNTFTIGDRLLNNVQRLGHYIYVTHKNELRVYNVSNPVSPQFVRTITINSLLGNVRVYRGLLWVLGRTILAPEQGGIWVFSLADPSYPQQVGYWSQNEPRDMCFLGDFCIVPCSGSGIYTLNISNPSNPFSVVNWSVSWPNTGSHGGYPTCAAGAGRFVFIGATSGNDPNCQDYTCPYYGARVYSVQVLLEPPIIVEVSPDPLPHLAHIPYTQQLTLAEGVPPVTWTLQHGPPGAQVNGTGLVSGWTPTLMDIGSDVYFEVKATNGDGEDIEFWSVRVTFVADGDFDNDNDSDLSDFAHLQACLSGDAVTYTPGCGDADFDSDRDVDGADLAEFLNCMRGANLPPGC